MQHEDVKLTVSPLHEDDRNPSLAHITFDPNTGGELQFITIPQDRIHDVVLALLNTHDALVNVRNVSTEVRWRDPHDVDGDDD